MLAALFNEMRDYLKRSWHAFLMYWGGIIASSPGAFVFACLEVRYGETRPLVLASLVPAFICFILGYRWTAKRLGYKRWWIAPEE